LQIDEKIIECHPIQLAQRQVKCNAYHAQRKPDVATH
jgi:hypothetical protein